MAAPPAASAGHSEPRAERARELVGRLAESPRPAGGDAERRARTICAERLQSAGFTVREEPFEYSAAIGRWGTPVGGIVAVAIVLSAMLAGRANHPIVALGSLTLGAVVLGVVARYVARDGVLDFPAARSVGVNLVATRETDEAGEPAIWLMAHLDSKSQPVPILGRALGVTIVAVAWLAGIGVAALQSAGTSGGLVTVWTVVGVLALVGAVPVIATTVGARSPGALDNATGVATVLAAAEEVSRRDVAVCLTSAEELGLAGARAWVRQRAGRGARTAINCDGVDDVGTTTCMYSGRRPDTLVSSILSAARRVAVPVRAHRLLPGVLTDGVALADGGWNVVTLSRGAARTLARIHTPRDRADRLSGRGMDEVARVIIAMLESGS